MQLIDAFLWGTAIAYVIAALYPKSFTATSNIWEEKLMFLVSGILIASGFLIEWIVPIVAGFYWIFLTVLLGIYATRTWCGDVIWLVEYELSKHSSIVQMSMFWWLLVAALCCLVKI